MATEHIDDHHNAPAAYFHWGSAALLGATAMAAVQMGSVHLAGNDGYYHLKMAALLPEIGFVQSFPWLRWTLFSDGFVSHHHGFHALLAPFVLTSQWLTGDAVLGGKIFSIVSLAVTFALFATILRRIHTRYPLLWAFLLCTAPWHFWLRMSYVRAPLAALPLLLLAVLWTLSGRTVALGLLAFAFGHVYGGCVLLPLVPVAFFFGALLAGDPLAIHFRQCVFVMAGLGFGIVINPYFPANLMFFYTQIFETGLGAQGHVGSEWRSFDGWNLLVQSASLAAVWLGCLVMRLRSGRSATTVEMAMLLLNIGFLILTLKSRRFVEYWPVFATLSAASFVVSPRDLALNRMPSIALWRLAWQRRGMSVVILVVSFIAILNLRDVRRHIVPTHDVAAIRQAMSWLVANSPAQSLVLTDDWDIFPTCFYFNHHNVYAVGLDPEFTRTKYPVLWERYRCITRGEAPADLPHFLDQGQVKKVDYDDIAYEFDASYVLVADDHRKLYDALEQRQHDFQIVYPADRLDGIQPKITIFEVLVTANVH